MSVTTVPIAVASADNFTYPKWVDDLEKTFNTNVGKWKLQLVKKTDTDRTIKEPVTLLFYDASSPTSMLGALHTFTDMEQECETYKILVGLVTPDEFPGTVNVDGLRLLQRNDNDSYKPLAESIISGCSGKRDVSIIDDEPKLSLMSKILLASMFDIPVELFVKTLIEDKAGESQDEKYSDLLKKLFSK